jgi:RND family efflux transporter MFP subunit
MIEKGQKEESVTAKIESRSDRRRLRARWLGAIIAIIVIALALWLWRRAASEAGRPVPAPSSEPVTQTVAPDEAMTLRVEPEWIARAQIKIEPVAERAMPGIEEFEAIPGVVQPNSYRTTPVLSLVGGIVRKINVELGTYVRRGQPIVTISSDELAVAQSDYLKALAQLDEHHKHHRRVMQLVEIGAASREELEQATTMLRSAEAEVARLRERLSLLGMSASRIEALRSSSQINSEVQIVAPVSGTVIDRKINLGEVVEANKELLRIADLSSVWIIAQVYEKDLTRVHVGSIARMTASAYPGRAFYGRVTYIAPNLDEATRTAQVRIEAANPNRSLKIDMYVNVEFGQGERMVPVVPKSAVQWVGNQTVVFVATDEPGLFLVRPVRLGEEKEGFYPVLEGVARGDRVATEGSFMLRAEWLKQHPNLR